MSAVSSARKVTNASVLRRALRSDNPKLLMRDWAQRSFYALFTRDEQGSESAACVPFGRELAILVTLEKDETDGLIESLVSSDSAQLFVKSLPLWELARFAHSQNSTLAWAKEDLVFDQQALELLGYKALVTKADGTEALVTIQVVRLEGGDENSLVTGDLQWWSQDSGTESAERMLVYDDARYQQDGGWAPVLPDNIRPVSSLSAEERTVFERWARPELPLDFGTTDESDAAVGTEIDPNEWLSEDCLEGPCKLYNLLDRVIFPEKRNFKLELEPENPVMDEKAGDSSPARLLKLRFLYLSQNSEGDRITPLLIAEATLSQNDLTVLPFQLPTAPGMHPVPDCLLGLLKRRLAWGQFAMSRQVDDPSILLDGLMRNLLIALPDNGDELFVCDPKDKNFPFLAAFECKETLVPVMVLGKQDSNLVCNPLIDLQVPEAQVPEGLPLREDLVIGGTMSLWALSGSILIPEPLIQCPEGWYKGVRVFAGQVLLDMSRGMHLMAYAMNDEAPAPEESKGMSVKGLLKWVGGILVAAVFVIMLVEA